jgi:hypothetical protein
MAAGSGVEDDPMAWAPEHGADGSVPRRDR